MDKATKASSPYSSVNSFTNSLVQYDTLPRKNNLDLDYCLNSNDYNHYMYYKIDKNKNIYMTCLKCNKNSFI